jgi:hypothetical protein
MNNVQQCHCGACTHKPDLIGTMKIQIIEDDNNFQLIDSDDILSEYTIAHMPCLIDCFESKINALQLVSSIFMTFSQIGGFLSV